MAKNMYNEKIKFDKKSNKERQKEIFEKSKEEDDYYNLTNEDYNLKYGEASTMEIDGKIYYTRD